METWFAEARSLPALEAEIYFSIQESLDCGSKYRVPLTPPRIERAVPSMVRSAEALGHERELAAYYAQIVLLARKYREPFSSIRHYFWLRFRLWNTEHDVHISFPWYDSLSEIERFIDKVLTVEAGLVDDDIDQGWEMEAHAYDGRLYIRQRDPDEDKTHLVVSVPRDALLLRLAELRDRSKAIIAALTQLVGADLWTSYVWEEPAFQIQLDEREARALLDPGGEPPRRWWRRLFGA